MTMFTSAQIYPNASGIRKSAHRPLTLIALMAASASFAVAFCSPASASEVDISSQVNRNIDTYYNGYVYPQNGGPITIGGVNFNLSTYSGGTGTGVVQTTGNDSFTIGVGDADVRTVYTIINSSFGVYGQTVGSLTFTGSGGASYTYTLTEGDNIRDHATTFYNTIAPNVYATEDFGAGDRLDVQRIVLPAAFGMQTLDSIQLSSTNPGGGLPFLAAVTTSTMSTVPLPASAPMFGVALLALGGVGYGLNRRRAAERSGVPAA